MIYIVIVALLMLLALFSYFFTKIIQRRARKAGWHIPYGPYEAIYKRIIDLILGLILLLMICPVILFVSILIRLKMGKPVFFKQIRPGKRNPITGKEKCFIIYKFRTMTDERDVNGELLPDEKRITKLGSVIRSTSLDELGELVNIVKGEMSFIGPRPLLVKYLPYYTNDEHHRHDVRPGLTGYAQINGRNEISWEKKFEYDIKYVNHITFWGDIKIFFCTIKKIFSRQGISLNALEDFDEYRKHTTNSNS